MGLIVSFSVLFFDGLLGYKPVVCKMRAYWDLASEKEIPVAIAAREWHATFEQLQLFGHFLSWPFVFMLGVYRWNPPNPFSPQVARLEHLWAFLPQGWVGVMTALVLWGLAGVLIAFARALIRLCNEVGRRSLTIGPTQLVQVGSNADPLQSAAVEAPARLPQNEGGRGLQLEKTNVD
jgi:hypothetical protein